MKGFAKDVLGVIAFLGLMALAMLLFLGSGGFGGGLAGCIVSLVGVATWYAFIDWVYKTKIGKKRPQKA